ncbi:spore coat protein [Paenibacillus sp. FSL L8-0470]|uniref:spore coat protein n=1 Tax=unclassified Paenibacillus TaxID=185978 RepID=UPI0030F8F92C
MNPIVENLTGMNVMTDQVIATDLLLACKSGLKNYAGAISESASPEVRNTLSTQFSKAVTLHEHVFNYMRDNGYYNAYDPAQQLQMDIQNADKALSLPNVR